LDSSALLIASAAATYDARLFRALLEEAEATLHIPFNPGALAALAAEVSAALAEATAPPAARQPAGAAPAPLAPLTLELAGKNTALLRGADGLVIKLYNREGEAHLDAYYSYPSNTKNRKLPKIGTQDPGYQRARKAAKAAKGRRRRMRVAQAFMAALCMLIGIAGVQALWYAMTTRLGVEYPAVFASLLAGFILYATLGEALLHVFLNDFGERQEFGEGTAPSSLFIIAFIVDVALHALIYIFMQHSLFNTVTILVSVLFFIYPGCYFALVFWSLKREVLGINTGKRLINRRMYANVPLAAPPCDMLPVTLSIACYTEDNQVIFDNIVSCLKAASDYTNHCQQKANIVVSDDGLAPLLGADLTADLVVDILATYALAPEKLTDQQRQAAARITFYREKGVAFVSRPREGRRGKFKKGGNLNFSYRFSRGETAGGYAEGEIVYHDIILLLDKDSLVPTGILQAAVPEFLRDPKLAYAQSVTEAANTGGNYFSRIMCQYNYVLQNTSLPAKALQGLISPLMGHNVFLRKSFLEESGLWSEDRVSEDFAKAIDAQLLGYHGKYLSFPGLAFAEYVSDTFAEETGKQARYCYGLLEIITRSFRQVRRLGPAHWLDLGSYLFSHINIAGIIPMFLLMLRYDVFHLVFGGILVNAFIYFLLPLVLYARMQRMLHPGRIFLALCGFGMIGLTFFAHNYSVLRAFFLYAYDRIRALRGKDYAAFPSSQVNTLTGSFTDGLRLIGRYYRKNLPMPFLSVLFLFNGIRMLTWLDTFVPAVVLPALSQFFFAFAVPILTPQLFVRPRRQVGPPASKPAPAPQPVPTIPTGVTQQTDSPPTPPETATP
jgi:cellulose synthase/poly-beta-1,6-N-acetylglucosamine synthase-like glycosyltransferase